MPGEHSDKANGHSEAASHTAVDVSEEVTGPTAHLQQEGYSQRERAAQEQAGLLYGRHPSDTLFLGEASSNEEWNGHQNAAVAAAAALAANMPGAKPPKDFVHPMSKGERYYAVVMFCLIALLLYADQQLMAPNLTQIADEFGFNAVEKDQYLGGYVGAAFFLVGAPAAVLMGYMGGGYNRCNLFFWVVILGEAPCVMTYFVTKYWHLLVLRLLTGISLGGIFPLVFSLLGDLFAPNQRAFVAALVQIAMGAGMSFGQLIAGLLGPTLGWRMPFVVVALPAIALATLTWYTVAEPKRGLTEAALQGDYAEEEFEYEEKIDLEKTKKLVRIRTNLCVILQGMPGSLPWGMLLVFFNDFLAQQKGFSVASATLVVSVFGIGGGVGVVVGGIVGQFLYNKKRRWMPLFTGLIVLTSVPPMMWVVGDPLREKSAVLLASIAVFMGGFSASACGPSIRAMIMNVNEPETRGVALALHVVLDDLGKGLGPAIVALLITALGRELAFSLSIAGWIPCGLCILGAYFTLEADEDAMQERLCRNHARASSQRDASSALASGGPSASALQSMMGGGEGRGYGGGGIRQGVEDNSAFGTPSDYSSSPREIRGNNGDYNLASSDDDDDGLSPRSRDGSPIASNTISGVIHNGGGGDHSGTPSSNSRPISKQTSGTGLDMQDVSLDDAHPRQ